MPATVEHSPPLHQPGDVTRRPKGILKNPSFSGPSGPQTSPPNSAGLASVSTPLDPIADARELTLQNTLQNAGAGHRRSSSAPRRHSSAVRRQSALLESQNQDEAVDDNQRLKWDEANLYLSEQDRGSRMKITEPKTPYEYGRDLPPDEEDEQTEVGIDPKFVNVDEVEMAKAKMSGRTVRKHRESEIPGLELGEPEEDLDSAVAPDDEGERIVRGNLSREGSSGSSSREKHVSVSEGGEEGGVGMPTNEALEKHRQFEEMRKKHYEMKDIRGHLGKLREQYRRPEEIDEEDGDELSPTSSKTLAQLSMPNLPDRGINGAR